MSFQRVAEIKRVISFKAGICKGSCGNGLVQKEHKENNKRREILILTKDYAE